MKQLLLIISLAFLLLANACMPNKDDEPQPYYSYAVVSLDSLGQASWLEMPAIGRFDMYPEPLPDGRILLVHDSLHIYNPHDQSLTEITPSSGFAWTGFPSTDLSPDGNFFYYSYSGTIRQLNLSTLESTTIASSDSLRFFCPTASRAGSYICFVADKKAPGSAFTGGFPLLLHLASGTITALASGNAQDDISVSLAWMSETHNLVYYHLPTGLHCMAPDGTERFQVLPELRYSWDGYDSSVFLYQKYHPYSTREIGYFNHEDLSWRYLNWVSTFSLSRNSRILYYSQGGKLYRVDTASGTQSLIINGFLQGRKIISIWDLASSWDGKEIFCMVTLEHWPRSHNSRISD